MPPYQAGGDHGDGHLRQELLAALGTGGGKSNRELFLQGTTLPFGNATDLNHSLNYLKCVDEIDVRAPPYLPRAFTADAETKRRVAR